MDNYPILLSEAFIKTSPQPLSKGEGIGIDLSII
jgi:hypothetical protein